MTKIPTGERLARLEQQIIDTKAEISKNQSYIIKEFTSLNKKIDAQEGKFVTKIEFEPIKLLTYGGVGFILLSLAGGIIYTTLGI